MDNEDELKPLLSVRETAKLLGVHENTVRNWVAAGTIVSARIPGSRQHRFAREEVLRLQKERGSTASSVAPALRTDGPELVTANELKAWAARADAKTAFPELMRRLLAATPGISNLEVRTHEGVAASGWDGSATSAGSSYLPAGELRFEFGTDADPKGKAQDDYDKRVGMLPTDANSIFVFATPRNWAGAAAWASDRALEGKFAGVKAIDAHTLEGWLQDSPPVHYWISERLGYRPRDVQTMQRWWDAFQARTTTPLPSAFFESGRLVEAEKLRTSLTAARANAEILAVQAPWRDDALAFTFAALAAESHLLERTLVVSEESAWSRLAESRRPLILIPLFSETPELAAATGNGHRVILIAEGGEIVRRAKPIVLGKVDRVRAREALKPVVPNPDEAEAMVALARRSMSALIRSIAHEPRLRQPDWVSNVETAAILSRLALIGSWSGSERDMTAIETLTGRRRDDVERLLRSLATRSDAPFVRSGGTWKLASPEEAALLLFPTLTEGELERWANVAADVLLSPDPHQGLDAVDRLALSVDSTPQTYSDILRKGAAEGLALAASSGPELPTELDMQQRVDRLVYNLLQAADSDESGSTWARLANVLPSLAEAAPDVFQDAAERDLDRRNPVLRTMFQDAGADSFFGPSSPHSHLLWALETLCWSPMYVGRAAALLGRLSALDPGGRLSNRPIESLKNVTTGWLPQSGADVDEKLAIISGALKREPDVGWTLALGVWPSRRAVAFPPHAPTYRDWSPARRSVTYADWGRFVHELVDHVIRAAGTSASRWKEIIPQIDQVPSAERASILTTLRGTIREQSWSTDEVYAVWGALNNEADQHEEYSDSEWALPSDEVATFRELAQALAPSQDARRFAHLFDWRVRVPNLEMGDERYDIELKRVRAEALDKVLELGVEALRALVVEVKTPHEVGRLLGERTDVPASEIHAWMSSPQPNLNQAAQVYVNAVIREGGVQRLREILEDTALRDVDARDRLMAAVPFSREYWTEIPSLGGEVEESYWKHVQPFPVNEADRVDGIRLLLQHGRAWDAMTLISMMLHEQQTPEVSLIKEVLDAIRTGAEPPTDGTMGSYHVGQILKHLERQVPDDDDLAIYEFTFFDFLHDHEPSGALYRTMSKDPANFVAMITAMFRAEGEPRRTPTPRESAFASRSFSVLHHWHTLPGLREDGTVDAEHLTEWVRSARLALADSGRASIGDEQVGQVLASSPVGSDGVWPAEAVREIIENVGNSRIDTGVHIGRTNQRGVTTRGVYDGGDQERVLEQQYREMAAKVATRWPRTARILRGIADSYQHEARRNDAEAERMGDEG